MSKFIEQLESRQYFSATMSLSNPNYLDMQASEQTSVGVLNAAHKTSLYLIRVNKAGEVDLRLEGLTGDASLQLISDKNHNNRLDSCEVIQKSDHLLAANESIRRMVGVGIYQVLVTSNDSASIINFTLRYSDAPFSTPDQVDQTGNSVAAARDLSVPMFSNRTVNEYIGGNDSADVFEMNVTQTTKYDIRLSGLTKDADVTLIDAAGDTLATTAGKTMSAKLISGKLEAGTYYMVVNAVDMNLPTGYALRVVGSGYRTSDTDLATKRVALKKPLMFSDTPISAKIAQLA